MSARHRFHRPPLWPRNTRDRDWCNVRTHPTAGAWRRQGRSALGISRHRPPQNEMGCLWPLVSSDDSVHHCLRRNQSPGSRGTQCAGKSYTDSPLRRQLDQKLALGGIRDLASVAEGGEEPKGRSVVGLHQALNRRTPFRRAAYVNRSSNARPRPRPCQSSATVIATSATSGSSAPRTYRVTPNSSSVDGSIATIAS